MTVAEERTDTGQEAAFRQRLQQWLAEHAPRRTEPSADSEEPHQAPRSAEQASAAELAGVERAKAFQRELYDAGFAGLTWPKEYGGQGLDKRYQEIFMEEASRYELPTNIFGIGIGMCAPTILEWGTDEQKRRYVPKILRAEEVWCQLFSEPGAGSDVASLSTRAVRDGDEWVLNGQKVWTSGAHYSQFGMCIARTNVDQPKHRGISMIIVDMAAPGVTVRPLRQITGEAHFNEVFFDDVRVPAENLVGPQDEGWRAAIAMLMNERVSIGASGRSRRGGNSARPYIEAARAAGLDADPIVRDRLADLHVRMTVQDLLGAKIRDTIKAGKAPGPIGSLAKLNGSIISKLAADLGMHIAGPAGIAWSGDDRSGGRWAYNVNAVPAGRIAGGTDEVQRNIIGERILGLPKDPQVDRDLPFRELRTGTQRG